MPQSFDDGDPDNIAGKYMLGPDGRTVLPMTDTFEWAYQFEHCNRIVAQNVVGNFFVSTVFLGVDHNHGRQGPPLLFETMVFRHTTHEGVSMRGEDIDQDRCSTWAEAERMHERYVQKARQGDYPPPVTDDSAKSSSSGSGTGTRAMPATRDSTASSEERLTAAERAVREAEALAEFIDAGGDPSDWPADRDDSRVCGGVRAPDDSAPGKTTSGGRE